MAGLWKSIFAAAVISLGASTANADDKLFVYVSPNSIGVNAFLQMGKTSKDKRVS